MGTIINFVIGGLLVILFFFFGHFTAAVKKICGLITTLFCKLLGLVGIKIKKRESHVKISDEFKSTYKDIKMVKLSKKNIKQVSSIDWASLAVLLIAGVLVLVNMNFISGNAISNWICSWLPIKMKPESMNTFYTATLFSVISFSLSRLLIRWKDTKQQRKERKESRIKEQAIALMSSKELLDNAKKKDEKSYKELK